MKVVEHYKQQQERESYRSLVILREKNHCRTTEKGKRATNSSAVEYANVDERSDADFSKTPYRSNIIDIFDSGHQRPRHVRAMNAYVICQDIYW